MKWLLVGFYDKVNISLRRISAVLKEEGQEVASVYLKSDRSSVIEEFRHDNKYYQYLFNGKLVGCGEDVNPATDTELDLLVGKAVEFAPDVVAFSCRSAVFELAGRVLTALQERLRDTVYVVGGYGPTAEPEHWAELFEFVCVGEGEAFVRSFIEQWQNGYSEFMLNSFQEDEGKETLLALPEDLDGWRVDWDADGKWLVEDGRIGLVSEALDEGVYDTFASKGCPSTCTYCQANQWRGFYKRWGAEYPKIRNRKPEKVIEELLWAKGRFPGLRYVRFMDSVFGWNWAWLQEFLRLYNEKVALPFFAYTDVRFMDRERFGWLVDAGLAKSCVGIQSASEQVRREVMGRRVADAELRDYAEMVYLSGVDFQYDLIAWNPFDTRETLREGFEFVRTLPPAQQVVVCELKMFPGSPITEKHANDKLAGVPKAVYDFYAWLYVMTLMGGDYKASAAWFWNEWNKFADVRLISQMRDAFALTRRSDSRKVRLNCDVQKGARLGTMMFDYDRSEGGPEFVDFDDRLKLQGCVAARDLAKGELLRWTDFHSSYGEKGAF